MRFKHQFPYPLGQCRIVDERIAVSLEVLYKLVAAAFIGVGRVLPVPCQEHGHPLCPEAGVIHALTYVFIVVADYEIKNRPGHIPLNGIRGLETLRPELRT